MGEPATTAVVNIGTLLSGDLQKPKLEEDGLLIEEGRIAAIGSSGDFAATAERVIDVNGATVAPGLIDSHCHVVLGDYTPRQSTVGFLASYVHGGITSVISPGEIHLPGRPHDAAGVKALAVVAHKSWSVYRPNGMKVNAGSIVIEPTLQPDDFIEVAAHGVRLAKYGFGRFTNPLDGEPQIRAAQAAGIKVMCHSGGASIPGSKPISADDLMQLRPDVCGHLNGGPTSLEEEGVARIIRETDLVLQVVQAGNLRSALEIVKLVIDEGQQHRVIIGSDTPTGTGVMPLGMLKTVAELCSLGRIDAPTAWAWASGVVADVYGLAEGRLAIGHPADLCIMDAPWGSVGRDAVEALERGDIPGVSGVLIDGVVRAMRSRNTPMAARQVTVTPEIAEPPGSGHV
jgi:enamidase